MITGMSDDSRPHGVMFVYPNREAWLACYLDHGTVTDTGRLLLSFGKAEEAESLVCGGDVVTVKRNGKHVRCGIPPRNISDEYRYEDGKFPVLSRKLCYNVIVRYNLGALFIYFKSETCWKFIVPGGGKKLLPVTSHCESSLEKRRQRDEHMKARRKARGALIAGGVNAAAAKASAEFNASMKRRDRKNRWLERMDEQIRKHKQHKEMSIVDKLRLSRGQVKLEMLPTPGALDYADLCREPKRK